MTRKEASEKWQIIKAYGEGKTIQFWGASGEWFDIEEGFELPIGEKLRIKPEENYTIEQNCGENRVEGGVLSISGSVNKEDDELWYVILNMNMQYEICRKCPKSGLFSGTHEECEKWILDKWNEEHPKQEKHYRPFNNCDELVETYHNRAFIPIVAEGLNQKLKRMYRPEIWVKHKHYGTENLITAFDNDNESIGGSCVFIQDMWCDMAELFEHYTFLDGSPCGVEE